MRLFVAIDIPEEVIAALDRLIARLKPSAWIKWCGASNLHITTKFIGEWPEPRLAEIDGSLRRLTGRGPIPIEVRGLGFFPNERSPRVFWAGIQSPPDLAALARDTDQALAALGIEAEKRPYSPHLTLARIKEPVPMEPLRQAISKLPSTEFGRFTAGRFYLYQSRLHPTGSVYTKLTEYIFG